MKVKVGYEKIDSFNKKQKEIKAKITAGLLNFFFDELKKDIDIFDNQLLMDLMGSILIVFHREILCHFIRCFGIEEHTKDIVKSLTFAIQEQVQEAIKKGGN